MIREREFWEVDSQKVYDIEDMYDEIDVIKDEDYGEDWE